MAAAVLGLDVTGTVINEEEPNAHYEKYSGKSNLCFDQARVFVKIVSFSQMLFIHWKMKKEKANLCCLLANICRSLSVKGNQKISYVRIMTSSGKHFY